MAKTVTLKMTDERATWLREALGEIAMAGISSPERAQMVHTTYWKLRQAHEGRDGARVKCDVGGAVVDMTGMEL